MLKAILKNLNIKRKMQEVKFIINFGGRKSEEHIKSRESRKVLWK